MEEPLGGGGRNRTAVRGFAGPCLNHSATPPWSLGDPTFLTGMLESPHADRTDCPSLDPYPTLLYGGIELVVDQLARGFQDAGHEVLLLRTGDSTCPVPRQWVLPAAEGTRIGMAVPEDPPRHPCL